MKKYLTLMAAGAIAGLGFGTSALAQAPSGPGGMTAHEHRQMMASPEMHVRMKAMMDRCENMMAKAGDFGSTPAAANVGTSSAAGEWAWRLNPKQVPGPRAPLLPPVRVWVPAGNSDA